MRSQPRLSGRHGIATSEQPGNGCIGSPGLSKLPARNWYWQSGEASPSRVLANRPIGAAPIINAPRRPKTYSRPVCAWRTQLDAATEMVLQIVADPRQFGHQIDAVLV